MLKRLDIQPANVVVADSFSPRMIAVIDHFRSNCVRTEMIQHGLIQTASKYRSHADIYCCWSPYEYAKVKRFLPAYTTVRFVGKQFAAPSNSELRGIVRCLIVMSPVQGIGLPYPKPLIDFLVELSTSGTVSVRLHPSDNREKFIKQLSGAKKFAISNASWEEDLSCFSHFIVFNSTCLLDILYADKCLATLMLGRLKYSRPSVPRADIIPNIESVADYHRFTSGVEKQSIREDILLAASGFVEEGGICNSSGKLQRQESY